MATWVTGDGGSDSPLALRDDLATVFGRRASKNPKVLVPPSEAWSMHGRCRSERRHRRMAMQLISTIASGGHNSVTPTAVQAGYGVSRNSAATVRSIAVWPRNPMW